MKDMWIIVKCKNCAEDFKRLNTASRQYCSKTCKREGLKAHPGRQAGIKKRMAKRAIAKGARRAPDTDDFIEFNILRESMGLGPVNKKEYKTLTN